MAEDTEKWRRTFELSQVEYDRYLEWRTTHYKQRHNGHAPYAGAAGGGLSFEFTPTGLGTCKVVKCMCGESASVTDFEDW